MVLKTITGYIIRLVVFEIVVLGLMSFVLKPSQMLLAVAIAFAVNYYIFWRKKK